MSYLYDRKPLELGRTGNGEKLYFHRTGGLIVGNLERDTCLLYTSDAADERSSVDLGGRRIINKKKKKKKKRNAST